ncbi:hypothetical protein LCGC14_0744400 [marine sediment metagenome]|uniref:Uncharacterized protein n=1 Tax=marine sediment metagenome TaxID=412755 RepID=A0A0F9Q5U0_9ZZZZ
MDIRELSDSLQNEMAHLWALGDAAMELGKDEVVKNLGEASRFLATAAGLLLPPPGGVKEPDPQALLQTNEITRRLNALADKMEQGLPAKPLDPLGLVDGVQRDVKRLRWPLRLE